MQPFRFALDAVLGFRRRCENEQQVVLAAFLAKMQAAQDACDEYGRRRDVLRGRLQAAHATMDSDELRMTYAHCDYLDRSIVRQRELVESMRFDVEIERAKLLELTKGRKILETLKERRREAYDAEAAALEQRESDEINARRYDRAHIRREIPT
jgi:flagellar export protein FliJ